jgi:hypothetical protein
MIDVYAEMFRKNTAAFVHDLPAHHLPPRCAA